MEFFRQIQKKLVTGEIFKIDHIRLKLHVHVYIKNESETIHKNAPSLVVQHSPCTPFQLVHVPLKFDFFQVVRFHLVLSLRTCRKNITTNKFLSCYNLLYIKTISLPS